MNTLLRLIILLCISTLVTGSACAAGEADSIAVIDPYVRLVPPGARATAAFMVLKNSASTNSRLVKVESSAARAVELHNHINDNGVMKMRQVSAIDIKANGEAALKPGGHHVMLIDPATTFKEGDKVVLTLGFGDGSSKTIEAVLKKPESAMVPEMDHSQHEHKH